MKYYAKTHTGAPRAGFITKGEVLTKAQEEALGAERLRDMVERGVLGVMGEAEPEREPKTATVDAQKPENPASEQVDGGRSAEDAEEGDTEEELPELGDADDLISEPDEEPAEEQSAKKTTKTSGRRK